MSGVDWARVGYVTTDGRPIPLSRSVTAPVAPKPAPVVTLSAVTVGKVTTVTPNVVGDNADLAGASWIVTPTPATYGAALLKGAVARFKNASSGKSTVTATVPRTDGQPAVTATITVEPGSKYKAGVFPRAFTWGGEAMKVEESFGFPTAVTRRARLIRTVNAGQPDSTVITERDVAFGADEIVVLSEPITFTAPSGKGHGHEYVWEIDTGPGAKVRSGPLPMWVYGTGLSRQSLAATPPTLPYPAVYTRKASDSKTVTPAAGKTYADHVAKFLLDWKATHLGGAAPGGAWLSFNDYNANIYYVDLDDASIPRYTFRQWDNREWGWTLAGWYGDDPWAKPFPRSKVAIDVPVPDNAAPSPGTDRSMSIVGMRAGRIEKIWEFWLAQKMGDGGWRAASIGVTTAADEWRHSQGYTVAASGISAVAYALRVREAQDAVAYVKAERAAGRVPSETRIVEMVPHALAINMPDPRAGMISYPATFSDGGSSDPTTAWEGQLVYLRGDADLNTANLTPLKYVIGAVGKHRGFRVTDKTAWSTTMIVEGDQSYGGGIWATLREANEAYAVKFPDDWFVIGRQYASKAEFDADTTTAAATGLTSSG